MSPSTIEYLNHILDEIRYLLDESSSLAEYEFYDDSTRKRAFVRSLEIVGEAAKQLPHETREQYGAVEWRAITGMRDRLIHKYFSVDYELVWDVVTNKIPQLQLTFEQMVADLTRQDKDE